MAISKTKTRLQVSLTKEVDNILNEVVKASTPMGKPLTKSDVIETALRVYIETILRDRIGKSKSKKEENN